MKLRVYSWALVTCCPVTWAGVASKAHSPRMMTKTVPVLMGACSSSSKGPNQARHLGLSVVASWTSSLPRGPDLPQTVRQHRANDVPGLQSGIGNGGVRRIASSFNVKMFSVISHGLYPQV